MFCRDQSPSSEMACFLLCFFYSTGHLSHVYYRRSSVAQSWCPRCDDFESRRLSFSYFSYRTFHLLPARSVQFPPFFSELERSFFQETGFYSAGQQFEARPGIGPRSIRKLREFLPAGLSEL